MELAKYLNSVRISDILCTNMFVYHAVLRFLIALAKEGL